MVKPTKTPKQIKIEKQIKELFDNDPLFQFRDNVRNIQSVPNLHSLETSRADAMKQAIGNYLSPTISKETDGISRDHLKILSDFGIPMHKYQAIKSDDDKQQFLLDQMYNNIKRLMSTLEELRQAKKLNDTIRINEINKKFQEDKGLYAWL